jgi:hypothetical protein
MMVSCLAYSSALKMEVTYSPERLVDLQGTTWSYVPEDRTLGYGKDTFFSNRAHPITAECARLCSTDFEVSKFVLISTYNHCRHLLV